MSRPKTVSAYPTYMLDILDRMAENPKTEVEMIFADKKSAENFRMDFYGFRSAAIKEGLDKMYPDMRALSLRLSGGIVTLFHKDHSKHAQIVARALELAKKKDVEAEEQRKE